MARKVFCQEWPSSNWLVVNIGTTPDTIFAGKTVDKKSAMALARALAERWPGHVVHATPLEKRVLCTTRMLEIKATRRLLREEVP